MGSPQSGPVNTKCSGNSTKNILNSAYRENCVSQEGFTEQGTLDWDGRQWPHGKWNMTCDGQKQLKCGCMHVRPGDSEPWVHIPAPLLSKYENSKDRNFSTLVSISLEWRRYPLYHTISVCLKGKNQWKPIAPSLTHGGPSREGYWTDQSHRVLGSLWLLPFSQPSGVSLTLYAKTISCSIQSGVQHTK